MFAAKEPSGQTFAVIGGGWAGCAAAVKLAQSGHSVTLFESTRILGGRARAVRLDGKLLDNGQHILLGAYRESLALMKAVGIDIDETLLRLPLQMRYPQNSGGMDFISPRLPAPWHMLVALIRADGLARADKLALARFSTTARWMGWKLDQDCSVAELLDRFDQTERLTKLMWRPLCIAALNTPPQRASAQVFLNVLRDSLGARRAASDMLLPKVDLTELFPQHAARFIETNGGKVRYAANVNSLRQEDDRWRLNLSGNVGESPDDNLNFHRVVLATPVSQTADLLDGHIDTSALRAFEFEPITTCYLRYAPGVRLPQPFLALVDDEDKSEWGQFVFDRGQLDAQQAGLFAVVFSASSAAVELDQHSLSTSIARQLAATLRSPLLAQPLWSKVISEKRATFSCTPGLTRPANDIGLPGLALAGDFTAGDYPATLESAVRSGLSAAQCLLD